MELHLQIGHGMMDMAVELNSRWGGGTSVLSPRDLSPTQLANLSKKLRKANGKVLLDPQFYLPHEHFSKLERHEYWPGSTYKTVEFWGGKEIGRFVKKIEELNISLGASACILPAVYTEIIDQFWIGMQKSVLDVASNICSTKRPLYITVAISDAVFRSDKQTERLARFAEQVEVDGVYMVCRPPDGRYIVEEANWLANLLDVVAAFRLAGKKVILGYSTHQMQLVACAGASAICSGSFLNVRSFDPRKFDGKDHGVKRKSTWYYAPNAMSEYKMSTLDIAKKLGKLNLLELPMDITRIYASEVFSALQPSISSFDEPTAFRHFLHSLHCQVAASVRSTFEETLKAQEEALNFSETLLYELTKSGIKDAARDFSPAIDANRMALKNLEDSRGAILGRNWWKISSH